MDRDRILSSENTIPSSPPPAVFSDETTRASSPPSSPPGFPWEQQKTRDDAATFPSKPAETAFSVLGKRKALQSISDNARPAKKMATTSKPLTQMQISLGQEVQKKCKTCGMEYVPSSTEDRALHDKYHKQNTEGYDVGKDFVQKARPDSTFVGARDGDVICAVDCYDKPARKKRGQAVLEVVQREMGAVEIPEKEIWDVAALGGKDANFRAYLYIRGTKCIGFLLVQKIKKAYTVLEPVLPVEGSTKPESGGKKDNGTTGSLAALRARQQAAAEKQQRQEKQPIQLSKTAIAARLGISRIWTSSTHRHQNIATTLLDTALAHYRKLSAPDGNGRVEARTDAGEQGTSSEPNVDAIKLETQSTKAIDLIAFSQPTEAGKRLARKWFGKFHGWSIYID